MEMIKSTILELKVLTYLLVCFCFTIIDTFIVSNVRYCISDFKRTFISKKANSQGKHKLFHSGISIWGCQVDHRRNSLYLSLLCCKYSRHFGNFIHFYKDDSCEGEYEEERDKNSAFVVDFWLPRDPPKARVGE